MINIELYIDGSTTGKKGTGGAAAIIIYNELDVHVITEAFSEACKVGNNQMEMRALVIGLKHVNNGSNVVVYTDSKNVIGWMNGTLQAKDPLIASYQEMAIMLIQLKGLVVAYEHVYGHAGNVLNEQVDQLAVEARLTQRGSNYRYTKE